LLLPQVCWGVSSIKIPSYLNQPGFEDLAGLAMPGNFSFISSNYIN
jgi:hypothetical protein